MWGGVWGGSLGGGAESFLGCDFGESLRERWGGTLGGGLGGGLGVTWLNPEAPHLASERFSFMGLNFSIIKR